jgi:hypothetical protein
LFKLKWEKPLAVPVDVVGSNRGSNQGSKRIQIWFRIGNDVVIPFFCLFFFTTLVI